MAKPTRRESRETAFMLLFEWSFKDDSLDEIIEMAKTARGIDVDEFALSLAEKVIANREEIDAIIERYSQGWKLSRISRTVLAVLRLSFCEMTKFGDIPVGASINEAVELVKKFGTDAEAAYLNGILGSFEQVRKGLKEAPPVPEKMEPVIGDEDLQKIQQEQEVQQEQELQKEQEIQPKSDEVELVDDIVIEVE